MASSQSSGATSLIRGGMPIIGKDMPLQFSTQTPFVANEKTRIVAVVCGNTVTASPGKDGWFMADFFAFNALYKGLCQSQTWLAAADPNILLQKYGNYLHGDPRGQRKVVLSNEMLNSNKLTPVQVVRENELGQAFINAVSDAATLTKRESGNLLLMIFCHGTPGHKLILGKGPFGELTQTHIQGAVGAYVPVTLLSTACYGGGWVCDPLFNYSAILAAQDDALSLAWSNSDSLGRACGSVFATSVVNTLTSTTSELLSPASSSDIQPQAPSAQSSTQPVASLVNLQPATPNTTQTKTYNMFCQSIVEACKVAPTSEYQDFAFTAQDNEWEWAWTRRAAIPLSRFKDKWDALETYDAPLPSLGVGSSFPYTVTKTGAAGEVTMEKTLDETRRDRIRNMVKVFLAWCPGSWDGGIERILRYQMENCAEKGRSYPDDYDSLNPTPEDERLNAFSVVRYRVEYARTVERIMEAMSLPKPDGKPLLLFNYHEWQHGLEARDVHHDYLKHEDWLVHELFRKTSGQDRTPQEGPEFHHAFHYVAASIYEAKGSSSSHRKEMETMEVLTVDFIRRMALIRDCIVSSVLRDRKIHSSGDTWLRSIGRRAGARHGGSPGKSQPKRRSIVDYYEGLTSMYEGEEEADGEGQERGASPQTPRRKDKGKGKAYGGGRSPGPFGNN